MSRRSALKRGAAVGGALAWAVPVVSVISMSSANAESPSTPPSSGNPPEPPRTDPPPDSSTPPETSAAPKTDDTPAGAGSNPGPGGGGGQPNAAPPAATGGSQTLAYTGFPTAEAVLGGAGLLAAGAALTVAASKRKDAEPELDPS